MPDQSESQQPAAVETPQAAPESQTPQQENREALYQKLCISSCRIVFRIQYVYARNTTSASVIVALNNDKKRSEVVFSIADTTFPDGAMLIDRLGDTKVSVTNRLVRLEIPAQSSAIIAEK